ncbi:hypothetical protein [Beijerinckia sp. L45]|uniref:hypothetical protein n=1 Tax=Beijerinckia sp. L45 TaxID=1641855 RepID=UPI00131C7059|nr:hypothetical protein [Beijerinckia sp. L45]
MASELLDAFGLSGDEISSLRQKSFDENFGRMARLSRANTFERRQGLSGHIAARLWECKQVLSQVGMLGQIMVARDIANHASMRDWEFLLERLYFDPLVFKNKVTWFLFQALLEAQRDFALEACPPRSHETYLTGELVGRIRGACDKWTDAAKAYLSRTGTSIEISRIDLSVGGYEQATGGDLALILDIDEADISPCDLEAKILLLTGPLRGSVIIPMVFQAKRYVGSTADISQHHDDRGYQFDTLRQTVCASNYLFYENGSERIDLPALPMVKPTSACRPIETSPRTEVFEGSVDLATYVLRAINGFADIPAANSMEDALNMILANASKDRVGHVAILANKAGRGQFYKDAFDRLMKGIAVGPTPPDLPEEPRF